MVFAFFFLNLLKVFRIIWVNTFIQQYKASIINIILYQFYQMENLIGLFQTIKNFLYYPAMTILVIVLGIAVLLYFYQNKMLYMPSMGDQLPQSPSSNPRGYRNPSESGMNYKNVQISTQDGQLLKGWLVFAPNNPNKSRTIIYYHENAGNIGTRIYYLKEYSTRTNSNILLIAYRGYSDSTGVPTEKGLKIDGLAILNYLLSSTQINPKLIYLHGRSLGGAVTAYVASNTNYNRSIRGIILQNTFTSISDMVDAIFSYIRFLKPLVQKNYWQTYKLIQKIKVPILFIKSGRDELVPLKQMQKLCQIAKQKDLKRKQYLIEYGTHNQTYTLNPKEYFENVYEFFRDECGEQI